MASFFIRARPQNLPPFLLDLAKKQRPRYCPTTVFLRPFIMLRNILWMHGKAPLPSSRRFLNPPPRSSLSSKQKRPGKRSGPFLPNQMKIYVYFGNINKPLCARGQREMSSPESKYRAMLTSCRYKNDQGERAVCMKDRFARKPARARSYRAAHVYRRQKPNRISRSHRLRWDADPPSSFLPIQHSRAEAIHPGLSCATKPRPL